MQRILVVEDDFDIQELLQNFLQETGYEVDIAGDGVEALSIFIDGKYDLILLDIMLPKIDGYGVCELIRKQSDVPIIMLTALNGEDDQIKGLDLQVDDYITKPFSMPILIRKIAAVLRRSSQGTVESYQSITYGNLLFSVKISIPLENTGVSSVFATSVWPFSLIFSLARRNEGNFFQAVPTTLSSSLAEVRLASLVAWA